MFVHFRTWRVTLWSCVAECSASSVHHRAAFSDRQSRSNGHTGLPGWRRAAAGDLVA